jgi:beta-phosphoglucomutase
MPDGRSEPRAVLWDMDGTLVDSADLHFEAWRATFDEHGRTLSRAEFAATFGQRNDTILRGAFGADLGDADVQRIGERKEAHYRDLVQRRGVIALPGVKAWLARLHTDGWRQAIASSGPRLNAQTIAEALGVSALFDALVSAEEVPHGKPAPDVFIAAAARVGVAPRRCVVVEDAPSGIEAGRRADMFTLGVLTTHAHLDADRTVRTLEELEPDAFDGMVR